MIHDSHKRIVRLSELPLWRLIVMLDDAERLLGPDSDSARAVARAISSRLRESLSQPAALAQEALDDR